jgi:membrane-associated phospholipid phosphatase
VNGLIVFLAQYLLYVMAVVAGAVWLTRNRTGKIALAGQAVLGLGLVGLGLLIAAKLHTDPRPFVHDPASSPLFSHAADNGFPSDHSTAAGLIAALVFRYQRVIGGLLAVCAALVAVARVAAHVHHAQDVVAGLAIGVVAGALAIALVDGGVKAWRRRTAGTTA